MNRWVLFLIGLLTFISIEVSGQGIGSREFKTDGESAVGAKFGFNNAWVRFQPNVETTPLAGNYFSLQYFYLRKVTGFSVELSYAEYGWHETFENFPDPEFNGTESYKRRLTYLEMPLLTYLRSQKGTVHIFGLVGPKISYMLNEEIEDLTPAGFERYYYQTSIEPHFEFGIAAGAGVSARFENIGEFSVEGRLNLSFSNLFEQRDTAENIEYSQPQGLLIAINYWYYLK